MAQSDGQWGETAWGDTDTVKEVEAGILVTKNGIIVITMDSLIPMGDK